MAAPLSLPGPAPAAPVTSVLRALVEQARSLESSAGPLRHRAEALRRMAQEALRLLDAAGDAPPPGPEQPRLSPREREVLELLSRGLSNRETATVLGISLSTVRTHVEHVLEKLDVSNRVEAVALGFRLGILRA